MKEACGWAGRTGSRSGTWPARASGCSTCPMTCPRPCATSRWSAAGCGSRPTAGWCASRVRRRGDNEEGAAGPRPGRGIRPTAGHLRATRRRGARPGDGLWVTGRLGGTGLALAALQRGGGPRLPRPLFRRFARPAPRIAAGRWLARRGARALIDISDGLAGDAGQLAAASGVRAEIALEWLPCWPGVTPRAAALSGEEYELLAALPPRFAERDARAFRRATGLTLTRIGRCAAGRDAPGLGAVRGEAGAREDPARRARDGDCGPRRDRPAAPAARRRGVRARGSGHQRRRVGRGVPRGDAQPHRGAPPVQERAVRAGDRRAGAGRPRVRAPYL